MGKFDHVAIFSDIDGTFLGTRSATVQSNLDAVKYFTEEGGIFTFATGRMTMNLPTHLPYVRELVNYPVVLNNGTLLYDFRTEEALESHYMEADHLRELIDFYEENCREVALRVTAPGKYLYQHYYPLFVHDFGITLEGGYEQKPYEEWDLSRIYKFVVRGTPEQLIAVRAKLESHFLDYYTFTLAGDNILEMQKKGTSKGNMIRSIGERFRREGNPRRIFCIGDHENDLEMLKAADVAACPSNALDSVKALCTLHLCDHNEGAIADLIRAIEENPAYCAAPL